MSDVSGEPESLASPHGEHGLTIQNIEPRTPSEPTPPSLWKRAGRITSSLFGPFRGQREDQHSTTQPPTGSVTAEFGMSSYAPGEVLPNQFLDYTTYRPLDDTVPPAPTTPTYNQKLFFEQSPTHQRTVTPRIARTEPDASVLLGQQPGIRSDSNATKGADTKKRRTWRQRFSNVIGSRSQTPVTRPAIDPFPYNPTVSDFGDVPSSSYGSESGGDTIEEHPIYDTVYEIDGTSRTF